MAGVPIGLPTIATTMTTGQKYGVGTPNYSTPTYAQIQQNRGELPPPPVPPTVLTKPMDQSKMAIAPPLMPPVTRMDTRVAPPGQGTPGVQVPNTPTQSGPPAPTGNYWQVAKDQAEQGRNFINSYQGGTNMTGTTIGDNGAEIRNFDFNSNAGMHDWHGPAAYGINVVPGATFNTGQEDEASAQLARIRQFDPNAKITQVQKEVGGGEGGSQMQTVYQIDFDQSKLPAHKYSGNNLTGAGGYGNDHVWNEDDKSFGYDPNYGVMTDKRNIDPHEGIDWLGILGPMAVGGFAGLVGGGGMAAAALQKAPGMIANAANGNFNPFQLAQMAAPFIPGMPSWGGQAIGVAGQGYNYINRRGG